MKKISQTNKRKLYELLFKKVVHPLSIQERKIKQNLFKICNSQ